MSTAESLIFLAHSDRLVGPLNAGQLKQMRETGEIQKYFWLWENPKTGWIPANPPPAPPPLGAFTANHRESVNTVEAPAMAKPPSAAQIPTTRPGEKKPAGASAGAGLTVGAAADLETPEEADARADREDDQMDGIGAAGVDSLGAVAGILGPQFPAPKRALLAICHDYHRVLSGKLEGANQEGCLLSAHFPHATLPPFRTGNKAWLNLLDETTGKSDNVPAEVIGTQRRPSGEWEFVFKWADTPSLLK